MSRRHVPWPCTVFANVKSRIVLLATILLGLGLAGSLLNAIAAPVWTTARARQPELRLNSTVAAAGQGVTLALLGGFRALVADATWIRMYALWERHELAATQSLIQLVSSLDPRPR
jgi:hypothetical protein